MKKSQAFPKVVLVTGAAKRIGAATARYLHSQGMSVIIHYRASKTEAEALQAELEAIRPNSARVIAADLDDIAEVKRLAATALQFWGRLDGLVNNASSFFPTKIQETSEADWDLLMSSNLKAVFFLCQACLPALQASQGVIINITDTHADRPMRDYAVYCMAKAGLTMLTQALAKELAPEIRVNAVAPGVVIWPENENVLSVLEQEKIIKQIPLRRIGEPDDIAKTIYFLMNDAVYITGQVIKVNGGRDL